VAFLSIVYKLVMAGTNCTTTTRARKPANASTKMPLLYVRLASTTRGLLEAKLEAAAEIINTITTGMFIIVFMIANSPC
jgi:hypothetical protein